MNVSYFKVYSYHFLQSHWNTHTFDQKNEQNTEQTTYPLRKHFPFYNVFNHYFDNTITNHWNKHLLYLIIPLLKDDMIDPLISYIYLSKIRAIKFVWLTTEKQWVKRLGQKTSMRKKMTVSWFLKYLYFTDYLYIFYYS